MTEEEFKDIREHNIGQIERVILETREKMIAYDKNDILEREDVVNDLIEAIVAAYDGIKKVASVIEFMDAWEENGDVPSLGYSGNTEIVKNFVAE